MIVQSGLFIEGISKEEMQQLFLSLHNHLESIEKLLRVNVRDTFTLNELAQLKGYSKMHMRQIISKSGIQHTYEGQELVISREDAAKIKPKRTSIQTLG